MTTINTQWLSTLQSTREQLAATGSAAAITAALEMLWQTQRAVAEPRTLDSEHSWSYFAEGVDAAADDLLLAASPHLHPLLDGGDAAERLVLPDSDEIRQHTTRLAAALYTALTRVARGSADPVDAVAAAYAAVDIERAVDAMRGTP